MQSNLLKDISNYTTTKNYKLFSFYFAATLLWLTVIFYNSSLDGAASTVESNHYTYFLAKIINKFTGGEISTLQKSLALLVRKSAHFSSYFLLTVFCFMAFKNIMLKNKFLIIRVFLLCVSSAVTDEFIQLFSKGRSGNFVDVTIDALGGLSALFLIGIINNLIIKTKMPYFKK